MVTPHDVDEWFTYHAPSADQMERLQRIRESAKELALVVIRNTAASADQTAALRKIREGVMTANAAVVLEGRVPS